MTEYQIVVASNSSLLRHLFVPLSLWNQSHQISKLESDAMEKFVQEKPWRYMGTLILQKGKNNAPMLMHLIDDTPTYPLAIKAII